MSSNEPVAEPPRFNERMILLLVAAVQFVNILDFMMVMPLGPDFAAALGISESSLGIIGGSYTAAAAVGGLVAARFLDRFDRRVALAAMMGGLVIGTAMGGLATGLTSLLLARVVAGFFGGPATAVSISIVADVVPVSRRGKAMGAVMISFSIASVLGVPAGLELARLGGWRLPFFSVAALGLVLVGLAITLMPPLRVHLEKQDAGSSISILSLVRDRAAALALLTNALSTISAFMLIPNISAFIQLNRGYPRDRLGLLYFAGGMVSLVLMRAVGSLVDRLGAPMVAAVGTALFSSVVYTAFAMPEPILPVILAFVGFMGASAFRNVSLNAQATRVPRPHERAGFMSALSAVQHTAAAAGAFLSAKLLTQTADHRLEGVGLISWATIAGSLTMPPLLWLIEKAIRIRESAEMQRATKTNIVAANASEVTEDAAL
ncbi:MAG: MFS transporter [Polyangiaceae bacterium]